MKFKMKFIFKHNFFRISNIVDIYSACKARHSTVVESGSLIFPPFRRPESLELSRFLRAEVAGSCSGLFVKILSEPLFVRPDGLFKVALFCRTPLRCKLLSTGQFSLSHYVSVCRVTLHAGGTPNSMWRHFVLSCEGVSYPAVWCDMCCEGERWHCSLEVHTVNQHGIETTEAWKSNIQLVGGLTEWVIVSVRLPHSEDCLSLTVKWEKRMCAAAPLHRATGSVKNNKCFLTPLCGRVRILKPFVVANLG